MMRWSGDRKKKLIVAFNIGLVQERIQVMGIKCIKDEDIFFKKQHFNCICSCAAACMGVSSRDPQLLLP